jgi:DNA-binding NarL/FixJ family response regulator
MNEAISQRILVIDPEDLFGEVLAFALKYHYHDTTQIIRSREAGWASLETEPADLIFIYLHADGVKATGCLGFKSLIYTIKAREDGLSKASRFCQQLHSIPKFDHLPVIVFGSREPTRIYAELQQAGATGYLLLPCRTEEMLAARDAALHGEKYYP